MSRAKRVAASATNRETLEIAYKGMNISDVLSMTVDEAVNFFRAVPQIYEQCLTLAEVGLGYIGLGQSATTLSGGEAQRLKLAAELSRKQTGRTLYIASRAASKVSATTRATICPP